SSNAPTQGEGVKSTFKTFSNPSGNVFSTFTAPRQASQPSAPEMTDQEHEDRMVDLFADHFGVTHDAILDQDGRNPRECARWYLWKVFPANDLREAAECYKIGRVFQQFYYLEDKDDFGKLRRRINSMLDI
ncbi:hypothetical protein, partial [Escherichia coli]|uniref:hypothetical protein n=1 Tax=Escherichia coli TaxID=562 RepID=UPI0032DAA193